MKRIKRLFKRWKKKELSDTEVLLNIFNDVKATLNKGCNEGLCILISSSTTDYVLMAYYNQRVYEVTAKINYFTLLCNEMLEAESPDNFRNSGYWWPLNAEGLKDRKEVCDKIIKKLEEKKEHERKRS